MKTRILNTLNDIKTEGTNLEVSYFPTQDLLKKPGVVEYPVTPTLERWRQEHQISR